MTCRGRAMSGYKSHAGHAWHVHHVDTSCAAKGTPLKPLTLASQRLVRRAVGRGRGGEAEERGGEHGSGLGNVHGALRVD